MLIVLSPAKSLDYETPVTSEISSHPLLIEDATALIELLRTLDAGQLAQLMDISPELAQLNTTRFTNWSLHPEEDKNRQAVFAFNGDVYEGLSASKLTSEQLAYLQKRLRILSGLYGILRPFDLMQAYRLEMGSRLRGKHGNNLYAFWGEKITRILNEMMQNIKSKSLLNLASEEYFKVVKPALLDVPVITPIFQDYKSGQYKIISFYAKRARGLMVRYCALNKIEAPEKIKEFDLDGYAYCEEHSDQQRWIFRRRLEA